MYIIFPFHRSMIAIRLPGTTRGARNFSNAAPSLPQLTTTTMSGICLVSKRLNMHEYIYIIFPGHRSMIVIRFPAPGTIREARSFSNAARSLPQLTTTTVSETCKAYMHIQNRYFLSSFKQISHSCSRINAHNFFRLSE